MKRISLIVALVLSTWSFASIVHAVGYISYVGLLTTTENKNSDTSNKINATSGDTVDFVISAQDAQGNDGVITSDSTLNLIGNFSGQELSLRWNFAGSWAESQNIMHAKVTIPSVYSENTICSDIVLRLVARVLTAHNQYTDVTKERTIRACSAIPSHTECSDGIDNDHDGAIDYPDDFSCASADGISEDTPKAQCQDGKDNDGDGLTDLQDPGCFSSQDNDETEIVATPTPSPTSSITPPTSSSMAYIEPTPPYSPPPATETTPSPIVGIVSPPTSPTITPKPLRGIGEAMSSVTGQPISSPVTAAAVAVATTAAAVSIINIVPSVASASTQTVSSFGNFFGIYFRKKRKSEHWVKVVDSITGKGIGGSMIQVRTTDGKVRAIWRTDDKTGNTGDLLPPGEYEFVVSKAGWRFPSYIQPIFTKQKGDIIYRRGVIEVDQNGKINIKGDKNE